MISDHVWRIMPESVIKHFGRVPTCFWAVKADKTPEIDRVRTKRLAPQRAFSANLSQMLDMTFPMGRSRRLIANISVWRGG